jgi:hypothetical protein
MSGEINLCAFENLIRPKKRRLWVYHCVLAWIGEAPYAHQYMLYQLYVQLIVATLYECFSIYIWCLPNQKRSVNPQVFIELVVDWLLRLTIIALHNTWKLRMLSWGLVAKRELVRGR